MNIVPEGIRRPLSYQNYRNYLFGQGVLLLTFGMQSVASSWLIYRLTGSGMLLGLLNLLSLLPSLLFSPVAGILVDKLPKKYIIMTTQLCAFLTFFSVGLLIVTDYIQLWHLMVSSLVFGFVIAIESPARNAFVIELVGLEDIQNAIGLNSTVFNLGRFVGPAISGFLIPFTGEGLIYLISSSACLVVIYMLTKVDVVGVPKKFEDDLKHSSMEGFVFAYKEKTVLYALTLLGLGSISIVPVTVLLPLISVEIYHGDSVLLGMFSSCIGVGALTAALYIASRTKKEGLLGRLSVGTTIFTLGMYAFTFSNEVYLAMLALYAVGLGSALQATSINTLLQVVTPAVFRGRVFALFSMMMMGMGVFGSLFGGTGGEYLGVEATLIVSALILTVCLCVILPLLVKHTKAKRYI